MGERKGVNKYYPPDYDPNKGGLNKFLGTHALRERARKLHMGILIIRFEMPYNIWCEGCEKHIGMGVRYNAEKKKVGMYYSTPIYQFRMKCHLCNNHFEIKTDPANLDYVIISGARRQEKRWDPADNEQVITEDKSVSRKLSVDAMYRLEHGVIDTDKSKDIKNTIVKLEDLQSSRWKDDYAANGALREIMRVKRKEAHLIQAKDKLLNLNVPLLPPSEDDEKMAALLQFSQTTELTTTKTQKIDTSGEVETGNNYILDMQSIFSKIKPVKFQPCNKRDFAMQSVKGIVSGVQRNNITPFCAASASSSSSDSVQNNLGIKLKKVEQVEDSGSKIPNNIESGDIKKGLIVAYDSSYSDSSD